MNDLVSIVVPVYNVQQYLQRCLKSLTEQTYRNIEIILVDDGSGDTSGEICDFWASRDERIRVFHKENGGLSDARNYGLRRVSGEYVCFVDSDDWCDIRYVEVMLKTLLETDSDIVECDYLCTDNHECASSGSKTDYDYEVFADKDCFHRFLTNVFFVSVCNKIYRKKIIEKEPFQLGVYHEDESWTYKIFSKARRVCRMQYTGYYYFQRQGSIVHTKPSHKRLNDAFQAGRERVAFIELHYPEYASIGYSKMMYTCMYLFHEAERGDFSQKDALQKELISYFHTIFWKYLMKRQYRGEMWRFCVFSLLPNGYCRMHYG